MPQWITQAFMQSMPEPWMQFNHDSNMRMCPFLTVNTAHQPHCIIYPERPRVCREFRCVQPEWYKP